MTLDVDTLFVASAIGRCAFVLVFIVATASQRDQPHFAHWTIALCSSLAGAFLMPLVSHEHWIPPLWSLLIYPLFLISLMLSFTGLRAFNGRTTASGAIALVAVVPTLCYAGMVSANGSPRVATSIVILTCLTLCLLAAREALQRQNGRRLAAGYVVAGALLAYASVFVLSSVVLLGTDILTDSRDAALLSGLLDQAAGVIIYFGYLAMAGERATNSLQRLAETDPLTTLPNRRGLEAALARRPAAHQGRQSAVMIIDIDHFKSINDRYGHAAGDAVLAAFGLRLVADMRGSDIACRWGGEEFLAVLSGANEAEAAARAEAIRRSIEAQTIATPAGPVRLTVSIGIAPMVGGAAAFETSVRLADEALYEAKSLGRNQVRGANPAMPEKAAA